MTDSVTSKMTVEDLVKILVILMDIPSKAEGGFKNALSKLPQSALVVMYETWVKANNVCEVAKRETKYAKEHLAIAERRIASLEKDLRKLKAKK